MPTPEEEARKLIDNLLEAAGWQVQDRQEMNLYSSPGVAVREFPLETGEADYLLFANQKAVGVVEAKPFGMTLSGVAEQSASYAAGLPAEIPHYGDNQLPFIYQSTGIETEFRNHRDPLPRSRRTFAFHKPESLAEWAEDDASLRQRLQIMPPINIAGLWKAQVEAIRRVEQSLSDNRPRALIQMATGSGKTYTAVNLVYRLIKYAKANRFLFLVDRNNLGRQAFTEFDQYRSPEEGLSFSQLYNIQRLKSNVLDPVSKVHITTIQRLYSMLSGESEFDSTNEEQSLFALDPSAERPKEVRYSPELPIEYYDFIITDECHRSIYNLWRQVLEYFDAFLIGLTATPSKQTFGFFNQNLVMEYTRQQAVADGVNVDGDVYRLRTKVTQSGGTIEAGYWVGVRDKRTRERKWRELEDDFNYDPDRLDRDVVSFDQIRTIIRAYREKLPEIFPSRGVVPKTLIFAKDDSHAEDIVRIVREEFGKGDEFCKKITYTVNNPEERISEFRISYNPRIAVSVDMIATGTDIRPLEVLLFMRAVKSRVLFEQMVGRGTRVVSPTELEAVTPDADFKDRFVIIDAVNLVEQKMVDTQTVDRKRSKSFKQLMESIALGVVDDDDLSSLVARFARLEKRVGVRDRAAVRELSGGKSLTELANEMLDAIDPDVQLQKARERLDPDEEPTDDQKSAVATDLIIAAVIPFASNPRLRNLLVELQQRSEQVVDEVTVDELVEFGPADAELAQETIASFRLFIEENRDEITALQILYEQPFRQQDLTFEHIRELADRLKMPPLHWTTQRLWQAYARVQQDQVRGANERRVLTDIISLVRHAVELEDELIPFPDIVRQRYQDWLEAQELAGQEFSAEQLWWLDRIAEHIGVNFGIGFEDFGFGVLFARGGAVAANEEFGMALADIVADLNQELTRVGPTVNEP